MPAVDKYNGKQTVVLRDYVLNRYYRGNFKLSWDSDEIYNSEKLDTGSFYQENQYTYYYLYSLSHKLWLDPVMPLGHLILTKILPCFLGSQEPGSTSFSAGLYPQNLSQSTSKSYQTLTDWTQIIPDPMWRRGNRYFLAVYNSFSWSIKWSSRCSGRCQNIDIFNFHACRY